MAVTAARQEVPRRVQAAVQVRAVTVQAAVAVAQVQAATVPAEATVPLAVTVLAEEDKFQFGNEV